MRLWPAEEMSTRLATFSVQILSASSSRQGSVSPSPTSELQSLILASCVVLCCPQDFGLTIDIDMLIDGIDTDGSGEIDFDEFRVLLTNAGAA